MRTTLAAAVAFFVALLPVLGQAQTPHVIQGRVTADSGGAPVGAADVIVTIAPSAETVLGKTDASGAYRITIARPTGEYILNVSALGFKPFRKRVTIPSGDTIATVDVKLAVNVQRVAAVRVQATRPRPRRSLGNDGDIEGADGMTKMVDGVTNALPPELQGNIDAMASLIPGLTTAPGGGFSAFGLGPDANMKTLNGMNFSGDAVPRDMPTTTRFASSPWDPTRGGFSGALAATYVSRGTNIYRSNGRVTLDAPMLQVGDPVSRRFGQQFTNLQLGGGKNGPLSLDKYFYSAGYQASIARAPVSSLLDLDPDALVHAGISPDSAFRLTQILGAAHVPLTVGGIPDQRTTFSGSFLERFDYLLPNPPPGKTPAPTWNALVGLNYSETRGSSLTPTAPPATTGRNRVGGGLLQAIYSRYFGKFGDYVNETSAGLSFNETKGTPYLELPSGNVLIASSLAGAAPTIGSINFGGNSAFARDTRTTALELNNQTTFLINDHPSLPTNIYLQGRYEHFDQSLSANRLGAFSYASLGDLQANRPSTFTRTLNTPDRAGGELMGAAAIGTSYNAPRIVITGGARVDANIFTGLPAANPAIERAFGVRNDRSPNSIAVSPRVGFNWYYKTRGAGTNVNVTPYALLIRGGPQIRGGIGEFRNFLRSDLLADAIGATGLPGSTERLICTGPAAPIPDWQTYLADPSSVPSTCAGGTSVFADTAATATIVDPSYKPLTAWRGTLGWTNTVLGTYMALDATYSLNLHQPGVTDLNFAGAPKFGLVDEGGRPVFVSPSSIVSSTGAVSATESRRTAAFGRVSDRVSDLRGDARQVTAYFVPSIPFRFGFFTVGYTWSDVRSQARGFDASGATDPRNIEWASLGAVPRHQFLIQGARQLPGRISFTTSMRIMSGLRYTPSVAGDVNGDGWSGDRAFIFDPSKAGDTAVARGLRDVLDHGSRSARNCLLAQLDRIAGRNSCVGPWSATMNASLFTSNIPRMNNRMTVTLNFANPLGGLDQLLHGSDHLHGWGMTPLADGALYQVRGFDQASRRFLYQVNPRFGNTNPSASTLRAPFRITLDVRMTLGPNQQEQSVVLNMRIKPPLVGTRAPADTIKNRYMSGNIAGGNGYSDIYRLMLRLSDSLALSRDQVDKLQERQKWLRARADSAYAVLGNYLANLPQEFDVKDAAKHVTDTDAGVWKMVYAESEFLMGTLTPGQIRLLPQPLYNMVTNPKFQGRFYFGP